MEARDEGAMVVELVVQPAPEVVPATELVVKMLPEEEPEVMVLGISLDPGQVSPSTTLGAVGVAPSFEGGLNAGQGPPAGVEWAMVRHVGTPNFGRDMQEEEEVWKAQYEVGSQIQAALERVLQLHKTTDFVISSVSALP